MDKPTLRRELVARRAARTRTEQADAAIGYAAAFAALRALAPHAQCWAGYVAVGAEPDVTPVLTAALEAGIELLLPIVHPDELGWGRVTNTDELSDLPTDVGALGLTEPADDLGADAIRRAGLVLCPALAVARDGTRLGKGAGYYDRALRHLGDDVPVVAAVYADELVDELPSGPHDVAVTHALTPGGVTRVGADN